MITETFRDRRKNQWIILVSGVHTRPKEPLFSGSLVQKKGLVAEVTVIRNVEWELPAREARSSSRLWVMDDGMDNRAGRDPRIGGADERGEVLMLGALPAGADNRAVRDTWRWLSRCLAGGRCSTNCAMPKSHRVQKW